MQVHAAVQAQMTHFDLQSSFTLHRVKTTCTASERPTPGPQDVKEGGRGILGLDAPALTASRGGVNGAGGLAVQHGRVTVATDGGVWPPLMYPIASPVPNVK
jgi:hypothetical protein